MIHGRALPWVRDVVPALGGLAIHFDPDHAELTSDALTTALNTVSECLKAGLGKAGDGVRTVEVPVGYESEFGPDLAEVGVASKMTAEEAVQLHAAADYRVLMIGFAPGHAYMGGLSPKLAVPRRAAPRAIVPAGSFAIANEQTQIYPYAISGGWRLIGRSPLAVFDADRLES